MAFGLLAFGIGPFGFWHWAFWLLALGLLGVGIGPIGNGPLGIGSIGICRSMIHSVEDDPVGSTAHTYYVLILINSCLVCCSLTMEYHLVGKTQTRN